MTGERTHKRKKCRVSQLPIIVWKVKYPLSFVVSDVRPVTQRYESRTVPKAPL